MPIKVITGVIGGVLVAILLSACSGGSDTQNDSPVKTTAVKCNKLAVTKISKRSVQLTAKASWAKKTTKKSPIRGYNFQLVDLKRDREPYHFLVATRKRKATFTFDDVTPGKYSARVTLQTSAGTLTPKKKCRVAVRIR